MVVGRMCRPADGLEAEVIAAFEAMQRAMVEKDLAAMCALTAEDKTFTHMSGKTQTREEFFGEILDGTLNYFDFRLHDPRAEVDGDRARLTGSVTIKARVYGSEGVWTLPVDARFARVRDRWVQCG